MNKRFLKNGNLFLFAADVLFNVLAATRMIIIILLIRRKKELTF